MCNQAVSHIDKHMHELQSTDVLQENYMGYKLAVWEEWESWWGELELSR